MAYWNLCVGDHGSDQSFASVLFRMDPQSLSSRGTAGVVGSDRFGPDRVYANARIGLQFDCRICVAGDRVGDVDRP